MAFTGGTQVDAAFDSAFDEAMGGNQTEIPGTDPAAESGNAAETPVVEDPKEEVTPGSETPAVETPAPQVDGTLTQILAGIEALKPVPQEPKTETPATEEPKPFELSAEAQEVLATVEREWPDVTQAMKLREEAFRYKVLEEAKKIVQEALAPLQDQIQPIIQKTAQTEQDKFISTIQAAHADAETLYPELNKWVEKLPRPRQMAANFVLDRGTAEEVVDLYTEFKQATGKLAAPVVETPPPTPPRDDDRLKRMEVVDSRRTASTSDAIDESDFDGAFAVAVSRT